MKIDPLSR